MRKVLLMAIASAMAVFGVNLAYASQDEAPGASPSTAALIVSPFAGTVATAAATPVDIAALDAKPNLPQIMTAGVADNFKARPASPKGDGITGGGAGTMVAAADPVEPDFTGHMRALTG